MNAGSGGKAPQVVATHVVALYRPSDGRVMHLHTVQVFEGGRNVSRDEAESELRVHAMRLGHDVGSLKIAHIENPPEGYGSLYYDSATNTLKGAELNRTRQRRGRN